MVADRFHSNDGTSIFYSNQFQLNVNFNRTSNFNEMKIKIQEKQK